MNAMKIDLSTIDVAHAAIDVPEDYGYSSCRDRGHEWKDGTTYRTPGKASDSTRMYITREQDCRWCGMNRRLKFLIVQANGRVWLHALGRLYVQPEGYHLAGMKPHEVAAAYRVRSLLKAVDDGQV